MNKQSAGNIKGEVKSGGDKLTARDRLTKRQKLLGAGVVFPILLLFFGILLYKDMNRQVCGQDIITRYNQAVVAVDTYAQDISAVAHETEKLRGYQNDPSCLQMVYRHYAYIQDAAKSRHILEQYRKLHSRGKQVDANLLDPRTLEQMEEHVKSLEHNENIGDKSEGSG